MIQLIYPNFSHLCTMSDSDDRVEGMRFVASAEGRAALQRLRTSPTISASDIQRLRKQWGQRFASALIEQHQLTKGLLTKFGTADLLATERSLQQASDALSAEYKAALIPTNHSVWDWCHGMGGDLRAFSEHHPCVGIDRDQALSIAAKFNAPEADVRCADVSDHLPPASAFLHADPDRRSETQRTSQIEYSSPSFEILDRAIRAASGACIKLAPAAAIPKQWNHALREWISVGSTCRQQVLWFGHDQTHSHRAVHLKQDQEAVVFAGTPNTTCDLTEIPEAWIYDADPAIRASGLSACWANHHQLKALGGPAGFFTAASYINVPLGQAFLALDTLALDERKLRARCQQLHVDVQEIKVRGVDRTPESLRKLLRIPEAPPVTLLIGRTSRGGYAIVAQRRSVTDA